MRRRAQGCHRCACHHVPPSILQPQSAAASAAIPAITSVIVDLLEDGASNRDAVVIALFKVGVFNIAGRF